MAVGLSLPSLLGGGMCIWRKLDWERREAGGMGTAVLGYTVDEGWRTVEAT